MTNPDSEKSRRRGFTSISGVALVASLFLALASIFGLALNDKEDVRLILEPTTLSLTKGDTFTTQLLLESSTPVNAVQAEIKIDPNLIEIINIDYNNSVLNLWVHEPNYKSEKGAIVFAGGITRPNGFTGQEGILTLTLKAKESGEGVIEILNTSVLKHDGSGTNANARIVSADYKIRNPELISGHNTEEETKSPSTKYGTDLNGDGKFNLTDISLFFSRLLGN